jgi:hypothetical protein
MTAVPPDQNGNPSVDVATLHFQLPAFVALRWLLHGYFFGVGVNHWPNVRWAARTLNLLM